MNILLVFNFYEYTGGEDIYFLSLAKLLKREGHQVYTYTKNSKDINSNLLAKADMAIGMFYNRQVVRELSQVIEIFKPDVVHFHNIYPLITPIAYQVCKKYDIPIVQTIHNYKLICPKGSLFRNHNICEICINKKFSYPAIYYGCYHNSYLASLIFSSSFLNHRLRKSFDHVNTLIFPTKFTRDYYLHNLSIPDARIEVIPYFTTVESLKSKYSQKKDYFLYVGRFFEEKGILPLLELFSSVPFLKLVVIGEGPLESAVLKFNKYKNILIQRYLSQDKIFNYMRKALFTIIPSLWYEVLPMVLIESFANGTAVIAPRFGSFKELMKDEKTGIFFENNNFKQLKSKIMNIIRNKTLIKQMGVSAREEYKKKYTVETHYANIMRVYNTLMK